MPKLTLVEVIACRDKLREAAALVSEVRDVFILAQHTGGARIVTDVAKLIADELRELDLLEAMLTAGRP